MRESPTAPRLRREWWWVFSLLIAAPALALALLGLRAIRVEQIERDQQWRDQQAQVVRLADVALANLLEGIVTEIRSGADQPAPAASSSPRLTDVFSLDPQGVLTFPRHKVYFGEVGRRPQWLRDLQSVPPVLAELIEQALAAEAQQRATDASILYRRISAQPALNPWADFRLARLRYHDGNPAGLELLADPVWARSDAVTPTGLPLAILASSQIEQAGSVPVPRVENVCNINLSPDGSRIVFCSRTTQTFDVWMLENVKSLLNSAR